MPKSGRSHRNSTLISSENILCPSSPERTTRSTVRIDTTATTSRQHVVRNLFTTSPARSQETSSNHLGPARIDVSNTVGPPSASRATRGRSSGSVTVATESSVTRTASVRRAARHDPMTRKGRSSRPKRSAKKDLSKVAVSKKPSPAIQESQKDADVEMTGIEPEVMEDGLVRQLDQGEAMHTEQDLKDVEMGMDDSTSHVAEPHHLGAATSLNPRADSQGSLNPLGTVQSGARPVPGLSSQAVSVVSSSRPTPDIKQPTRRKGYLGLDIPAFSRRSPSPARPTVDTSIPTAAKALPSIKNRANIFYKPSGHDEEAAVLPKWGKNDFPTTLQLPFQDNMRSKITFPNGSAAPPLITFTASPPPPCPKTPTNSPTEISPSSTTISPALFRPGIFVQPPSPPENDASDWEANSYMNPLVFPEQPPGSPRLVPRDLSPAEREERERRFNERAVEQAEIQGWPFLRRANSW